MATLGAMRDRLERSALSRRFLHGAFWSVVGAVGASGINLLMMMLVARLLGKSDYGQLVMLQSTLAMIGVFAGFGIGATAMRYAAELRASEPHRLGHILALSERTILVFGLMASVGLAVAARWMATNLLNAPGIALPLLITACSVFFMSLDSYQKSVLIGLEAMRAFALGSVMGAVLGLPIMLLAASQFGLLGAAIALLLNSCFQFSISRYQMVKELSNFGVKRNSKGCMDEWKVLRDFALPALLSGALVSPAHWLVQAMLTQRSNGYSEVAALGVAMQWFNLIMFLPNVASRVVLPILTEHLSQKNHLDARRLLMLAVKANVTLIFPLAAGIALASSWIMNLYGSSFKDGSLVLSIAACAAALVAVNSPVGNIMAASSKMWFGFLMNLGWAVIYIFTAYMLIGRGAVGVAMALLLSYVVHTIWVALYTASELWKK